MWVSGFDSKKSQNKVKVQTNVTSTQSQGSQVVAHSATSREMMLMDFSDCSETEMDNFDLDYGILELN